MRARSAELTGCLLAGAGAFSYGVTVVVGRTLAREGVTPATALGFRFAIAALLALAVLAVRGTGLLPQPGERLRVVALGAVGYTTESTLFFLALQRGTAAAAALLFYTYPVVVIVLEWALTRTAAGPRTLVAMGLSVAGTVVVVASTGTLAMSRTGAAFALGSAVVFALYLLACSRAVHRTDSLTRAAWIAAGAALSSLGRGAVSGSLSTPGGHELLLAGYGLATAAAFCLMFAALARLGPSRTAVVMTLEAFSAVVLAAAFLHEPVTAPQLAGGAAILGAAAVIASARARPPGSGHDGAHDVVDLAAQRALGVGRPLDAPRRVGAGLHLAHRARALRHPVPGRVLERD